jgi:hypothetical protein
MLWEYGPGDDADELRIEAGTLRARLDMLAESFADGDITRDQLQKGSSRLRERLEEVERGIRRASASQGLGEAVSASHAVRHWASFDVNKRRAFIEALAERITLNKRPKGQRGLRAGDIEVTWKGQSEETYSR